MFSIVRYESRSELSAMRERMNLSFETMLLRWAPSVRLLTGGYNGVSLLDTLQNYDKDNMQPKILERIRKDFVPDPKFTPAQIAKASSAAEGLCKWVLAMVKNKFQDLFQMFSRKFCFNATALVFTGQVRERDKNCRTKESCLGCSRRRAHTSNDHFEC